MTVEQHVAKLNALLQPHRKELDAMSQALQEVAAEEAQLKVGKIKELIRKAQEIKQAADALDKQYKSQRKKFEKELGKVMSSLERFARNEPEPEEGEEEKTVESSPISVNPGTHDR